MLNSRPPIGPVRPVNSQPKASVPITFPAQQASSFSISPSSTAVVSPVPPEFGIKPQGLGTDEYKAGLPRRTLEFGETNVLVEVDDMGSAQSKGLTSIEASLMAIAERNAEKESNSSNKGSTAVSRNAEAERLHGSGSRKDGAQMAQSQTERTSSNKGAGSKAGTPSPSKSDSKRANQSSKQRSPVRNSKESPSSVARFEVQDVPSPNSFPPISAAIGGRNSEAAGVLPRVGTTSTMTGEPLSDDTNEHSNTTIPVKAVELKGAWAAGAPKVSAAPVKPSDRAGGAPPGQAPHPAPSQTNSGSTVSKTTAGNLSTAVPSQSSTSAVISNSSAASFAPKNGPAWAAVVAGKAGSALPSEVTKIQTGDSAGNRDSIPLEMKPATAAAAAEGIKNGQRKLKTAAEQLNR
ncbi:hypothetical protein HDU96_003113 [Phlyctochytrium bullatum]|nr:hypothetical protein HDU96_003113 [Phlyctochytrium bullatum]